MTISKTGVAVLLTVFATAAAAAPDEQKAAPHHNGEAHGQVDQGQHDVEGAHGYQNPAGEDPKPRLSEETIENAHGTDAPELKDDEKPHGH